jgi:hypothetical protein
LHLFGIYNEVTMKRNRTVEKKVIISNSGQNNLWSPRVLSLMTFVGFSM